MYVIMYMQYGSMPSRVSVREFDTMYMYMARVKVRQEEVKCD